MNIFKISRTRKPYRGEGLPSQCDFLHCDPITMQKIPQKGFNEVTRSFRKIRFIQGMTQKLPPLCDMGRNLLFIVVTGSEFKEVYIMTGSQYQKPISSFPMNSNYKAIRP